MQLMKRNGPSSSTPDLFGGLFQLHRELDRMFDWGHRGLSHETGSGLFEGAWMPAVDVCEDKDDVRVKAELPGLKKEDIQISVQGDTLVLKGERKMETDEKKENYHRVERVHGQFHRTITLPAPVKPDGANAKYENGVLEVTLHKQEEAKPRQIQVEVK